MISPCEIVLRKFLACSSEKHFEAEQLPFPWKTLDRLNTDLGEEPCQVSIPKVQQPTSSSIGGGGEAYSEVKVRSSATHTIMADYIKKFPDLSSELSECNALGAISFQLPRVSSTSGKVLAHAVSVVEKLLSQHAPMIFQIGYTHSPSWRWGNALYGYSKSRDQWSHMVVLSLSSEPYSAGMLEAALIHNFKGNSVAQKKMFKK